MDPWSYIEACRCALDERLSIRVLCVEEGEINNHEVSYGIVFG